VLRLAAGLAIWWRILGQPGSLRLQTVDRGDELWTGAMGEILSPRGVDRGRRPMPREAYSGWQRWSLGRASAGRVMSADDVWWPAWAGYGENPVVVSRNSAQCGERHTRGVSEAIGIEGCGACHEDPARFRGAQEERAFRRADLRPARARREKGQIRLCERCSGRGLLEAILQNS